MTKAELIKAHNKGELKSYPYALAESMHHGLVILHIEYDINDKIFGYRYIHTETTYEQKYFYCKIHDQTMTGDYFLLNGSRYYLNEFMGTRGCGQTIYSSM